MNRTLIFASGTIGAICLVLGAGLFWSGRTKVRAASEQSIFPLPLEAGEPVRGTFQTSARFPLQIWLVLRRHQGVTDEQIDDYLLGTNSPPPVQWSIHRQGVLVATGDSKSVVRGSFGAQESRGGLLGEFRSPKAGQHDFLATVGLTQEGLGPAQPAIEIRSSFAARKNAGINGSAETFAGTVMALLGLVLVGFTWRTRRIFHE